MIEIDEAFVDLAAPNASAMKNGRGLVLKNKLVDLCQSPDQTLLFGECKGSGKSNYIVSVDFIAPGNPVYRCTCPSRQFPCKHCLGLMYAYTQGKTFTNKEIPDDIAQKRQKAEKRAETKKSAVKTPRKVNKSALAKKIQAQLNGLDLLETLTYDLVRGGLGVLNAKAVKRIEEQAKQLGDAYLTGAQDALRDFTNLFNRLDKDKQSDNLDYSEVLDRLIRLQALLRHGRQYLTNRLNDPDLKPDTDTDIAAWLGHAWQLQEMRELGLMRENVELIQLSFNACRNDARQQIIETGVWINLSSGDIQLTHNYRPYKAAKYIKEDDSVFKALCIRELFVYPGDMNPRIRWEEMQMRDLRPEDLQIIRSFAHKNYAPVIKSVKNQLKSPLADKYPLALLWCHQMGQVNEQLVMADSAGERLILKETDALQEPETCALLPLLPANIMGGQAIMVRFHHNIDTRELRIKPLCIITENEILRLSF